METVNALKLRNNLGGILDRLAEKGEPILVSRGRKIRAVLVTPQQFEARFLDWQIREEKDRRLAAIKALREKRKGDESTIRVLRGIRGYET
jgi:antitoxin (DNA-binding transcriptional repressor) of toxin-antitoxin stability system